jgi:hypothetical protein
MATDEDAARTYSSTRSICFCAIWLCIRPSSSQKRILREDIYAGALRASQKLKTAGVWVGARCALWQIPTYPQVFAPPWAHSPVSIYFRLVPARTSQFKLVLPKAKSKPRSKQNKDMHKFSSVHSERGVPLPVLTSGGE